MNKREISLSFEILVEYNMYDLYVTRKIFVLSMSLYYNLVQSINIEYNCHCQLFFPDHFRGEKVKNGGRVSSTFEDYL